VIIFNGSKIVGGQTILSFKNEHGQIIDLSFNSQVTKFILDNFSRLNPPTSKNVEYSDSEISSEEFAQITNALRERK
jgi:hypothetical protein